MGSAAFRRSRSLEAALPLPVIVVGSGPSGVHAATSLLAGGRSVLMIDAGQDAAAQDAEWTGDWSSIRAERADQYRLFWGEDFEGIPWGEMRAGAGLTPPRRGVVAGLEEWLPTVSNTFRRVESLAAGGLGGAWGLGAFALTDAELTQLGLPLSAMRDGYRRTAARIGISGTDPVASGILTPGIESLLPPLRLDPGAQKVWERYDAKRTKWLSRGIILGKTPLALLSSPLGERRATEYSDMDFYTNSGRSAYRPQWTLEELRKNPRFERVGGVLATDLFETAEGVTVNVLHRQTRERSAYQGCDVILCAGALGSARVLLRSAAAHRGKQVVAGLICSPYRYMMGMRLGVSGLVDSQPRHSMGQLVIACGRGGKFEALSSLGSVLSYRSLLLTRLLAQSPLPLKESRAFLQAIQSRLQLTGAFLPDDASEGRREVRLVADAQSVTGDHTEIIFEWGSQQKQVHRRELRRMRRVLWGLGCPTLAEMDPGPGGSIHYSGTVPFSSHPLAGKLSCDPATALVHGYRRVRIGDGSAFRGAPAAGVTWSLMAFADQVGQILAENRTLC